MTSLETLLKEGTKVLEQHKIQEARLDAWLLLEHVTGMNRAFYFAHSADGILPIRHILWDLNFM